MVDQRVAAEKQKGVGTPYIPPMTRRLKCRIDPEQSPYTCVLPEHKPVRRGREMIDLLAVEEPKPKPAKIRAVSYEAAIDQLFKRMRSSSSALTQQAVSNPRSPVPNERRRRRPPHGRRTETTGEWPPATRGSPPAPAEAGRGPPPRGRVRSRCTSRGARTRPGTRRRRRTSAGRRRTPGGPRCARGCGRRCGCDGRRTANYSAGSTTSAPFFFRRITMNFAGSVVLALRPTVCTSLGPS